MLKTEYFQKTRITSATTTQVANGQKILKRIVVNVPVSTGTVAIYDAQSGTDNPVGVITSTADLKPYFIDYDVRMENGIRIITTQAQDITVVWA